MSCRKNSARPARFWPATARRRSPGRFSTLIAVIKSWACERRAETTGPTGFRPSAGNPPILEAPRPRGAFAFHAHAVLCFFQPAGRGKDFRARRRARQRRFSTGSRKPAIENFLPPLALMQNPAGGAAAPLVARTGQGAGGGER